MFTPIVFGGECVNTIDAAIARVESDALGQQTPAEGYGVPKASPTQAMVGLDVKKFGRSSGLTFGQVLAINATVEVSYGHHGVACFTDQIIISPGEFSIGGDSGSLVVSDSDSDEGNDDRPVGLVFAGSPSISVANDISNVLDAFSITIDGESGGNEQNGNGNNGNNGNHGDGNNGNNDGPYEAWPQGLGELQIYVVDSSGDHVGGIEICAWSSATNSTCGNSAAEPFEFGEDDYNWTADLDGTPGTTISISPDTKYMFTTKGSTNALYQYWEDGDQDKQVKFTVTNESEESGSFSNLGGSGNADVELTSLDISNLSVGSPREGGTSIAITWDADWDGSGQLPSWIGGHGDATVKLTGGATETLEEEESHATGNGSLSWTPSQLYSNIKVKVEENSTEDELESSSFNVISPIDYDIDGPTTLEEGVQGTWSVSPEGGTTPYTYDWDYMLLCTSQALTSLVEECDNWYQGGTGSSWNHTVSGALYDLQIRSKVTDSSTNPAWSKTKIIVVDITDS